ncbi:MAG: NADAR family protein [Pseudomonadota bacterium]
MSAQKIRSVTELRELVHDGLKSKYVLFWGHTPTQDGSISKSCFSQWFEAAFQVDGVRYPTAEHFMMAQKARLFSDQAALAKVLKAASPGAAKAAGREVAGFNEQTWLEQRWDIVVKANLEKFSQNPALLEFLLATHDRILVESSPVDKIWGTGIAADDARAEIPSEWEGLNLLGFALMEVRTRLAES